MGGAEAIISHLVTQHLRVPCAHAPALGPLEVEPELSPRACAEELGEQGHPYDHSLSHLYSSSQ